MRSFIKNGLLNDTQTLENVISYIPLYSYDGGSIIFLMRFPAVEEISA